MTYSYAPIEGLISKNITKKAFFGGNEVALFIASKRKRNTFKRGTSGKCANFNGFYIVWNCNFSDFITSTKGKCSNVIKGSGEVYFRKLAVFESIVFNFYKSLWKNGGSHFFTVKKSIISNGGTALGNINLNEVRTIIKRVRGNLLKGIR